VIMGSGDSVLGVLLASNFAVAALAAVLRLPEVSACCAARSRVLDPGLRLTQRRTGFWRRC